MQVRCPTCGKKDEVAEEFRWRPFCSRRCKMVDLGNWLEGVYRISSPIGADDLDDNPALLSALISGSE